MCVCIILTGKEELRRSQIKSRLHERFPCHSARERLDLREGTLLISGSGASPEKTANKMQAVGITVHFILECRRVTPKTNTLLSKTVSLWMVCSERRITYAHSYTITRIKSRHTEWKGVSIIEHRSNKSIIINNYWLIATHKITGRLKQYSNTAITNFSSVFVDDKNKVDQ